VGGVTIRVLVVDDYQPFRAFVCSTLQKKREWQDIHEAADGLEAVRKAEELRPHLIVLDIGLPQLNGIEAARQIRKLSPESRILFVSQESSADVVEEALRLGAWGYVVKAHAGSELLAAAEAVCQGRRFVGSGLSGRNVTESTNAPAPERAPQKESAPSLVHRKEVTRTHQVGFYPDDDSLLAALTRFVEAALKLRNPIIVVATDPHRMKLFDGLQSRGWDVAGAIRDGGFISLDSYQILSTFMVNDWPDSARLLKTAGDLIRQAAKAAQGENGRVAACGAIAPVLLAQGKVEAAIQVEHLWDTIARSYDIDVLCAYSSRGFQCVEDSRIYERICREHSAVVTPESAIPIRRSSVC
jgi:DNA-binding NarL/FixJ family response regulator